MPPRTRKKKTSEEEAAAPEIHLSTGHKHKKSVPGHKNSKKKDDKAIGMRKSAPESYDSEMVSGVAAASTTTVYKARYGVDKEEEEEEEEEKEEGDTLTVVIYKCV